MKKLLVACSLVVVLCLSCFVAANAVNNIRIFVNGQEVYPDVPPQIVNGRVLVPLRFVSNTLGAMVDYDAQTRSVIIASLQSSVRTCQVIESRIDGDFEGWEGETIFALENGQVWQQDSYDYTYHYHYRPEVVIYPSGNRYKMIVEGVDIDDAIYVVQLR